MIQVLSKLYLADIMKITTVKFSHLLIQSAQTMIM